jgi:antitoxin ParD1/3/4
MTTVTMNISLNNDLKSFVDTRIAKRGYSSASEYVRDLIRRDEEKAAEERLKALIEEGIASGPAGNWNDLRTQFLSDSGVSTARSAKPLRSKKTA